MVASALARQVFVKAAEVSQAPGRRPRVTQPINPVQPNGQSQC
jgi:hypothetical protein